MIVKDYLHTNYYRNLNKFVIEEKRGSQHAGGITLQIQIIFIIILFHLIINHNAFGVDLKKKKNENENPHRIYS